MSEFNYAEYADARRKEQAEKITQALAIIGNREVSIEYSGGGDSGDFETPVLATDDDDDDDIEELTEEEETLFGEAACMAVDLKFEGWENNSGGCGVVTINSDGIHIDHTTYIEESEYDYMTINVLDGTLVQKRRSTSYHGDEDEEDEDGEDEEIESADSVATETVEAPATPQEPEFGPNVTAAHRKYVAFCERFNEYMLAELRKELLAANTFMTVTAYTPAFNDGDPCFPIICVYFGTEYDGGSDYIKSREEIIDVDTTDEELDLTVREFNATVSSLELWVTQEWDWVSSKLGCPNMFVHVSFLPNDDGTWDVRFKSFDRG